MKNFMERVAKAYDATGQQEKARGVRAKAADRSEAMEAHATMTAAERTAAWEAATGYKITRAADVVECGGA